MPAAIAPAIVAAAGAMGATLTVATATAFATAALNLTIFAGSAALSRREQRKAQRAQREAYNASLKDREVMIRSAIAPRRVVLGRDRISGPIIYAESTGNKGQFLHLVIALAHGECDAIEEVWFNDVKLPEPDASGFITTGEFTSTEYYSDNVTVTASVGGALTLPHVASKVISVTAANEAAFNADGVIFEGLVIGWAHATDSNIITGLAAGGQYRVNYDRRDGHPRVRIKKHLGGAGQVADADLVAESNGKWTSAHVGKGITYLYARLEYDQDVWGQIGIPNITCVVRGGKMLDPRSGSTVWSENAALIAAKWLRDDTFGLRATSAQLIAGELIAEANICDESVELNEEGDTQKRYTFNGSFTSDESPRDVLEDILASMAGSAVWVRGRWLLRAGAYRTPAPVLDEDALAGSGVSIVPRASRSGLFNAVRITHRDRSQGWAEVQAPLVANAFYQAEDGGKQLVRSVTLPGEMDTWRAQRLAKIILERARQSLTVELTTNLRGYDLAPTDTVPLSIARYGFDDKVFEVRSRTYDPNGNLQYQLVETAADVWAWNHGEATVGDMAPNTSLPNPYGRPAALTGLLVDASAGQVIRNIDSTRITQALVTWNQSQDAFVVSGGRIDVQWKLARDVPWQDAPRVDGDQTRTVISPIPYGDVIIVRVRAVNAAGVASEWTSKASGVVRSAPGLPPENVAGLAGSAADGVINWSWTAAKALDYVETELRSGGSTWENAAFFWRGRATGLSQRVSDPGTYTVRAKHLTTSGQASTGTASASVTVTAADLVQGEPGEPGLNQTQVYLYQWATVQPGNPNGTSTWNWSTQAHSAYTGSNGWSVNVPTNPGTAGQRLWVAPKSIGAPAGTVTTSVSWVAGFSVYAASANGGKGDPGAPGIKAATVTVYRWEATIPTAPVGTSTYTWNTGTISSVPSGWALNPGPGLAGQTRWGASVQLIESAGAATSSVNWTLASIVATGYRGTDGAAGADGVSARRAYALTPLPSLGSGTVTSTGGGSLPAPGSFGASIWMADPVAPGVGQVLYQSDGLYDKSTNTTTWATPYISALKVGSLSALAVNTGDLTVQGTLTMGSTGVILGGQTAYGVGDGYCIGYSGGRYVISIGNGVHSFDWDGATIRFRGDLLGGAATSFSSGLGLFAGGTTGANYRWRVGNPGAEEIRWTGSAVEVCNSDGDVILRSGQAVPVDGYRGTNPAPQDFRAGESFFLKANGEGFGGPAGAGTYGVLRTLRPHGTGSNLSGGAVLQWFESNGLVWARRSTSATAWSAWEAVPNGTITPSNISNFFAAASIGELQVANASMTTLKLAGQAVTVPQFYSGANAVSTGSAWKNIISATFDPQGGGLIGMVNFFASPVAGGVDAYGRVSVVIAGLSTVVQDFGVRTAGADTIYKLPISVPFAASGLASGPVTVFARISSIPNPGGATVNFDAKNITMSIMSGKR